MSLNIQWDERFSVGIKEIDDQHKELFKIIDAAFDGFMEDMRNQSKMLEEAFDRIIDYARYHFATEEKYFSEFHYPDAEAHKRQHTKLLSDTLELKRKYLSGEPGVSFELIDFLTTWLQTHILLHDKQYAPFVKPTRG